ncbi:MAG: SH3 domain-containing protein [Candidatus Promineifilaceae bacterium]
MVVLKRYRSWLVVVGLLLLGLGCNLTTAEPTPTLPLLVITMTPSSATDDLPTQGPGAVVTEETADATPTLAATATSTPVGTAVPTVALDTDIEYRVVHVDESDVLNVRSGPGASNEIVTDLEPGSTGVRVVGFGQMVSGSLWVPINVNNVGGWVNSRFLTEDIPSEQFCNDPEPRALLDELKTAVENQDGNLLAEISNPERGLRLRRYWRSDGVRFENQQVNNVFNLTQSYFWGTADGSGEDINGSFSEIMLPLLERNLVGSSEVGCNEILHGGTAGSVQLPFRYEGVNYYSMYRPAPADNEFDWGSWVVGIERWQETYFVSFLVHFEWEI